MLSCIQCKSTPTPSIRCKIKSKDKDENDNLDVHSMIGILKTVECFNPSYQIKLLKVKGSGGRQWG